VRKGVAANDNSKCKEAGYVVAILSIGLSRWIITRSCVVGICRLDKHRPLFEERQANYLAGLRRDRKLAEDPREWADLLMRSVDPLAEALPVRGELKHHSVT
jgi:hypothetical protein